MNNEENRTITDDNLTVEQWLQICKDEALRIDAETAEVYRKYAQVLDPYGVDPDLPPECQQIGRAYFARNQASEIWVWFGDLPKRTRDQLSGMHEARLAFPGGFDDLPWLSSDDRDA